MKIVHIVHQYPPDHLGGTELCTQDLARLQASSGHSTAVFVPSQGDHTTSVPTLEDGVRVYRQKVGSSGRQAIFFSTFWNRSANDALKRIVDQEQPDLVHIQHMMGLPASLVDVLSKRNIPFVVTLHDFYYICANAQLLTNYDQTLCDGPDRFLNCARCSQARGGLPETLVMRQAIAPLMRRRNRHLAPLMTEASAIIALSSFVRDTYARMGTSSEKMTVIPNGIRLPAKLPAPTQSVQGELRVVYLGGVAWQKGVHVLVEAANDLPSGVTVTIYGDLSVHKTYSTELRQKSNNDAVTFAGRLERKQVWAALSAADVVVVPSIWYENSPLIIQETRAVRTPVITSNLGALPEQVSDGHDGLLFPTGNSIALRQLLLELQSNHHRLQKLKDNIPPARSIDQQATEIESVYHSVLGNSNSQ